MFDPIIKLGVGFLRLIADCEEFLFELKFVMGFKTTGFTVFPSLRIQPPLIRFRYYVRANWEAAVSGLSLSRKTVNTRENFWNVYCMFCECVLNFFASSLLHLRQPLHYSSAPCWVNMGGKCSQAEIAGDRSGVLENTVFSIRHTKILVNIGKPEFLVEWDPPNIYWFS